LRNFSQLHDLGFKVLTFSYHQTQFKNRKYFAKFVPFLQTQN